MNIAVIHYHLRTGGVARVIHDAALALSKRGHQVAVIVGEAPPGPPGEYPARVGVMEALAYGMHRVDSVPDLVEALRKKAAMLLGQAPDVWHVHNHALGKNNILPLLVDALARAGERLVLQVHDFAEDGRPANYAFLRRHVAPEWGNSLDRLYPQAGGIAYAAINDRDADFLRASGMEHVVLLPNPVACVPVGEANGHEESGKGRCVYPTRAIRRKNIGEFLLLSAISEVGEKYAVTRAPLNPAEQAVYHQWVVFARANRLDIHWEYGRHFPSSQAIFQSARIVLTTSIAEGFGLVYLEPWLAGRPLAGRNLPRITQSLCENGIDLSSLYDRLNVPVEWLDMKHLRHVVRVACCRSAEAYGLAHSAAWEERIMGTMIRPEGIDFGRLDEHFQQTIIRRVIESAESRAWMASQIPPPADRDVIQRNREVIRTRFNLDVYADRLLALYGRGAGEPGSVRWSGARRLLEQFHQPEQFTLLRT